MYSVNRVWVRTIIMLLTLFVVPTGNAEKATISLVPSNQAIFARTYFGMHVHNNGAQRNWPDIPIGSIRLWDARVGWMYLEQQKNVWQFERLDEYVDWAESHGVDVLLPLGVPPRWASARPNERGAYGLGSAAEPANMNEWRIYVRTLAKRYHGRIYAYEIWNEANLLEFYSGSIGTLTRLIEVASEELRKVDPQAKIVAPSGQGLDGRETWTSRLLNQGAGKLVDVVSFHLYHAPSSPESMIAPILHMRELNAHAGLATKPLWNTESGYFLPNNTANWSAYEIKHQNSVEMAATYLPRDMLLSMALGFERYYWYVWDNAKMGFLDPVSGEHRRTAEVLSQFINTLMRSKLRRCDRDGSGMWTCQLIGANGLPMKALWIDPSAKSQHQSLVLTANEKWMLLDGHSTWQTAPTDFAVGSTVTLVTGSN